MASIVDFYKQKLAPKLSSLIDRDQNMAGTQLMQGGLGNNAKSFGKQFVQAAAQTAPTVAQDFGNMFRNTFKSTPLLSTAGNIVGDFGQRVGSSVVDVAQGAYRTAQRPDLLGKAQGVAQTIRGVGKGLVSAMPATPFVDIAANIGKQDSLSRRLATGYSRGISQIPELAPNTVAKNISIGDKENPLISFDPAMTAANMVGFVKNPINAKLFQATNKLIPSADKSLKLWLATTASRGGLENILLAMPEMPEKMSTIQKAQWMATNAGIGAAQEIVGQGIVKGLTKAGGTIADSKAGKYTAEQLAKQFDNLNEFKRKATIPVSKPGFGPKLGQTITEPMWKWEMGLVDDGSMKQYNSDIDTPKLSVEPTPVINNINDLKSYAGKFKSVEDMANDIQYNRLWNAGKVLEEAGYKNYGELWKDLSKTQKNNFIQSSSKIINYDGLSDLDKGRVRSLAEQKVSIEGYPVQSQADFIAGLKPDGKVIQSNGKVRKMDFGETPSALPNDNDYSVTFIDKDGTRKYYSVGKKIWERLNLKDTSEPSKPLSVEPVGGEDLLSEARKYGSEEKFIDEVRRGNLNNVLGKTETLNPREIISDKNKLAKIDQGRMKELPIRKDSFKYALENPQKDNILVHEYTGLNGEKRRYVVDGTHRLYAAIAKKEPINATVIRTNKKEDLDKYLSSVYKQSSPLGGKVVAQGGLSDVKKVTPIRRPLKEVYKEKFNQSATVEPQVKPQELQTPSTQVEAPKPVVSSDTIITPAGNLPKRSGELKKQLMEVQQNLEQSQVVAEQNKLIRDNFSPEQIKDINQLKILAKKSLDQGGDIETLRGKYPKLVESVTSHVREADQTIVGDSEALDFALSLPTKAETRVDMSEAKSLQKQLDPITKLDQAGVAATTGDKSVTSAVVEPTPKTVKGITTKQNKLDTANEVRARKKLDDEWQKAVFGEAQTRTVKQAEKALEKAIKTSTNEATFKLDTADGWKDKNALSLGTETMDRNFEDIMGKQAPELKRKLLEPVYKSEAQRTKFLNTEREQIKKLGIKAGSKESSLVQEYGEGNITAEQLKQQTANPEKIIKASEFIRGKYDEYLGQLNKVLTRNGYEPIPKRSDYFHHFQELTGAFDLLGVSLKAQDLPTDINGLTADFKPGKTFFSAALQRLGGEYTSDAIGGIDKYLEGASNQIYHTDNIQALRSFETALREKFAGTNHLSNFVANLSEYTNGIAGKKSMIDRAAESIVGRGIYGAATGLKRQVGANMVGANVSSALTNFIPLTQTLATTDKGSVLNAIMATIKNVGKDDGFIQASDFLTTRSGTDRLAKSLYENVADKAGWLFKNVDSFVSQVVTRSKYLEGIKKGMSESSAMDYANSWAKKLMAGRGKGEMPTLFNSQTLGAITQFQLEVKNQLSFMAKDIPRNFDKVGSASAIAQLFLYGYLFNNIYEKVTGRRPAFDPIGVGQRTYEDYTNPDMKKGQATKNLVSNVSNQLPFVSTFTGGRLPITSAIPNPMAVVNGESTLKKELMKPLQFVLPTGGGQIKKSVEGISAYNKGVSTSPSGRVRYVIPQTTANRARTAVFGQWSTLEAQKYLREGQSVLGESQSKVILESSDKQGLFDKIKARQLSDKQLTAVKDTLKSGNTKSAAVTTGKYVYFDDKTGDVNTLDLSKVTSMPSSTNYETVKKETEKWKVADDILKLDPTDQVEAFKQLGISKDDAEYYTVAKDTTEAKAAYIKDQVQGVKDFNEFATKIAPLRKEINGEKILSDGVIDWMYNNDIITSSQKKQLKSIDFKGGKATSKATKTVKKITAPKLAKFNLAGKVKKVKRIRTKVYKLKI